MTHTSRHIGGRRIRELNVRTLSRERTRLISQNALSTRGRKAHEGRGLCMEHFRGSRPGTIEVAFPRSRGTSGLPNNVAQTLCAKQQLSRGPPGVVVRHEAAAGSCSPSRLPSQRRAPHSEPGAAAQGDAGGPGSGEQRVRRGEGRSLATGKRCGWGTGWGKGFFSIVCGEGALLPGERKKNPCFMTREGSRLLLGDQKRPCV